MNAKISITNQIPLPLNVYLDNAKPVVAETALEYTGGNQSLSVNYDTNYINQNGTISASDTGVYTAIFALKNKTNTIWEDSTKDDVSIEWSIGAIPLDVPTLSPVTQTSQGLTKTHSVTVSGYDANKMTMTGSTSTNTGKAAAYTVTFALKDGYQWSDGSTSNKTVTWRVLAKTLTATQTTFVQTDAITYDGKEHSAAEACSKIDTAYIGEYYTLTNATATNAGEITTTVTPTAAASFSTKSFTWKIDKAALTLSTTADSYPLHDALLWTSFGVNTDSDGNFSATAEDSNLLTVTSSFEKTVKLGTVRFDAAIGLIGKGSTTITINQAEGTNYLASSKTVKVTYNRTMNSFTWAEIASVVKAGNGAEMFPAGSSKQVEVNGTVGLLAINATYRAVVIGIDHNAGIEGTNRLHFAIMKTSDSTKQICFTDAKYGVNGQSDSGAMDGFVFHNVWTEGRNYPYSSAVIRTRCTAFLNALPAELQNVITACKKYSLTGSSNAAVTDKIWIPSAFEIAGKTPNVDYSAYCQQYEYFANGNSKVCYKHNSTNTTAIYWTRDYDGNNSTGNPVYINTSGAPSHTVYTYNYGFLPCFTIS